MMAVRKINKLLVSTIVGCLCSRAVWATEIDMNTAQMQAMDKITGRVSIINVPINTDVKFGSFSIVVRTCKTRPPEDTPENFAFADIVDSYNNEQPMNIFRGWMMSSTPGLNAVEHPIYDVWLLKCINTQVDKSKLMTAEQLKDRDGIVRAPQITEREEYKSPQLSTEKLEQPIEVEFVLDEKVLENKPIVEAVESEPIVSAPEDPVLIFSDTEEEDGAPKSLLNIGGMQETTDEKDGKKAEQHPTPLAVEKEVEVDIDLFNEDEVSENTISETEVKDVQNDDTTEVSEEPVEETLKEKAPENVSEEDEQLFSFDD